LQVLAVGPLAAGAWLLNTTLLQIGAWSLAAGVAVFLVAMLNVLKHLWRPVVGAATPKNLPPT
jgi:hypothetical protein